MIDFAWKPDWLWTALGTLLVIVLVCWSYWSGRGQAHWAWRFFFAGLRLVTITLVVICLLDPQWVKEIKHYPPSHVALLLDTSRSMDCKDGDGTRLAQAKEWIRGQVKLPQGVSLETYGFSSNLVSVPDPQAARAGGDCTSYAEALKSLSLLTGLNQPDSVIVLSDGNDNSLQNFEPVARAFGQKHLPIHTVAFGTTSELPDLVIENVQVKRRLPHQTTARATVTLRGPGFEGKKVPLRIVQNGRLLGQSEIEITGGTQRFDIEFTPPSSGFQSFAAEIPSQKGERTYLNNHREFGLTISDQTLRVLYMEASGFGQGAFQPTFLKHALEDVPGIEIKTLYCEQYGNPSIAVNRQPAYVDPKNGVPIYRVRHPTEGYPQTLEGLLKYHVIICSDIPQGEFTARQLENTEKFVTQYGGGFVMVGGNTSFGSGNYQRTIIDRLIPVAMELETSTTVSTFVPRLTANALTHPIMQISADKELNEAIWTTKFPKLLGYNRVDRPKPGAVVLLGHPTAHTLFGPDVILAVQDVGKGRTMAFTSDTTSDWGQYFETIWGEKINDNYPLSESNCDSRYYKQFWVNSVRWLAAHKFNIENNLVSLEVKNTYCTPNTEIPVLVHVSDRAGKETHNARVKLQLSNLGEEIAPANATYDEQEHAFVGTVKLPQTGMFTLTAEAIFDDGQTSEDRQVILGEETDIEMADIRAKPATLAALSRLSGGKVLDPHNGAKAVTEALGVAKPPSIEYQRTSLWDVPPLLAAIIGMLGLEWLLRRWRGLA